MSTARKQKEEVVGNLKKKLKASSFVAFLNFHGLTVAKAMELRRNLRKSKADYVVGKKTLIGVASKEAGLDLDLKKLTGEVGVVFSEDAEDSKLSVAKDIATFARKNSEILKIIGGFWDKAWIDMNDIKKLAAIPSREALLTQLAFMLTQPVAGLARVLNEVSKKLDNNKVA